MTASVPGDIARAVGLLTDRAEVSGLIDQYLIAFDLLATVPRDDAWYRSLFTDDLRLVFPVGGHAGLPGVAEFNRAARARWARTHHLSANHRVTLDGDRATVRGALLVTHVPGEDEEGILSTGSHFDVTVVRTPSGWRISELVFHLAYARKN